MSNLSYLLFLSYLISIYLTCYNVFLQFLYYRRKIKRLRETVVSIYAMLSFRALERSNNPFIESIVEFCVSKNQKRSSLCGLDWNENPGKGLRHLKNVSLS